MPWQLIYTSAPRGLLSGQSGFCTVARSADLREALVQRLEQISSYHYLRVAEAAQASRNPAISAFRLLDLRGAKYYVLTRIQPCGLDFTARTNHLAHHLVFQPDELATLPSPAALLRHWPGWLPSWQGEPRLLEEPMDPAGFAAATKSFLPAHTWTRLTGDGGRAAGLLERECLEGCYLLCPPGSEEQVLEMYCETLELLNFNGQFPQRPWRYGFTSFLQAEDNPNDFKWRACQENTPAYKQALTRSAPMIPLRSVRVPANDLVKRAREEPKPPPPASPPPSDPSAKSNLSLRREASSRRISTPPPLPQSDPVKKTARAERPAFLNLNFSINTATLLRLGIPVAVLVALLLVRHYSTHRPVEQGNPVPAPAPPPPAKTEAPPKAPSPIAAPPDAKPSDALVSDEPTYVLVVPNLAKFSLPIDSISRLQSLLRRYNRLETLPIDIQLEVATDRWNSPPGEPLKVGGTKDEHFSASGPGLECVFDYSGWLSASAGPLAVQANFDRVPGAFSMHFGFSSPTNGDPFRLLIINENNPPAPLRMARKFAQNDRQELLASLKGSFSFLDGRQLQYRALLKPETQPSQYLYKNWPASELPDSGHELDFGDVRQHLQAHRLELRNRLGKLSELLGLPLGQFLGSTNSKLESFAAFSHREWTQRKFAEYLDQLKQSAPDKSSWITNWHNKFDPEASNEVSDKFQKLYELWSDNRPKDKPKLTLTLNNVETNYFFAAWQRLQEMQSVQDQLDQIKKRSDELDQAYIALCIVDPKQPKPGLEMIRFEGP
jgi:hypothetical protein